MRKQVKKLYLGNDEKTVTGKETLLGQVKKLYILNMETNQMNTKWIAFG